MENPPAKLQKRFAFTTQRPPELSNREARFCEAYALTGKAKASAVEAGYAEKYAHIQATQLRKRERVRAYISALQSELANGGNNEPGSAAWIRARYVAIASVSAADLVVTDSDTGRLRWKLPAELSEVQRAAIAEVLTRDAKRPAAKSRGKRAMLEPEAGGIDDTELAADGTNEPALVVCGYKLHSAAGALDALAKIAGLHRADATPGATVNMRGVFQIVAGSEATSETSARLRALHGAAGARTLDVPADVRPLARLRGV